MLFSDKYYGLLRMCVRALASFFSFRFPAGYHLCAVYDNIILKTAGAL